MDNILFPNWTPAEVYQFMLKHYDYSDGGAFAEVHVPQFPNGFGLSSIVATNSATSVATVASPTASPSSQQPTLLLTSSSHEHNASSSGPTNVSPTSIKSPNYAQPIDRSEGALIAMPTIPDTSKWSSKEENTIRKAQGGLLVVHTPESALTTKSFTAEELQKPSEEAIQKNLDATREALAAQLADLSRGIGGGMAKQPTADRDGSSATSAVAEATTSDKPYSHNPFLPNAVAAKQQLQQDKHSKGSLRGGTKGALAIIVPGAGGGSFAVGNMNSSDPAPVLRSPTKRQALQHQSEGTFGGAGGATVSTSGKNIFSGTPAVVNNYRNKKGIIFSLGQRSSAQGATTTTEVVELNSRHFEIAKSLSAAQKEMETAAAANVKAQAEASRRAREREEAEVTRKAQEVLEARAAALNVSNKVEGSILPTPSAPAQRETREQRAKRIQAEREARDEEVIEERREKRLDKAAQRLGMAKEALLQDKDLLEKVNAAYAAGGAQDGSGVRDAEGDLVDPRIMMLANKSTSRSGAGGGGNDISSLLTGGEEGAQPTGEEGSDLSAAPTAHQAASINALTSLHSNARIMAELERQKQSTKDGTKLSGTKRHNEDDDSSDDDVFGLQAKHHRSE